MAPDPASPEIPAAELSEATTRRSVKLIGEQLKGVFISLVFQDAFLIWLLSRVDLFWAAVLWAAANLASRVVLWRVVDLHRRGAATAARTARRLVVVVGLTGVARAAIIPLLFSLPVGATHYIFTMVLVGQVAGAVASLGALYLGYVAWAIPVVVTAAVAWMVQGNFEGGSVGVLLLLLLLVLASYVRRTEATLRELVSNALENERLAGSLRDERDRVREVSDSNRVLADSLRDERDRVREVSDANLVLADSLRVERDAAEAASQSKTRFFAAASHDLRQPLQALSVNATTLEILAVQQAHPTIRELSQSIGRALQQSNDLLDGLLDISRLDAGAVEIDPERFDVRTLLRAVVDEFSAAAAQRGLVLRCVERAPDDERVPMVETDFDTMHRIVNNLVGNGLKFTATGSVELSARVDDGGGVAQPEVVVEVRDTGCGIVPAERERVFEEFYQIGNPSRDRNRGLGLGLSIVRRSATLLGAKLALQSEVGVGSCFSLRLPWAGVAARAAGLDAPLRDAAALPDADVSRLVGARVLVIDDEPEVVRSIAALLRMMGCEARCAESLAEARAAMSDGWRPTALVVDHRLRDGSGVTAITEIRASAPEVAAILVTGDTSPANLVSLGASGLRVFHKPIDGRKLAEALSTAIAEMPNDAS